MISNSVSVVTICFNNLQELQYTCASVDAQLQQPDEHLIIDGSSNSEILAWLQQTHHPVYRRWMHERDNGISDAMNKGIRNSKGSVVHILHAGDRYYSTDALRIGREEFDNDPKLMWLHSLYVQVRGGVEVITGAPFNKQLLWKGMRTVAHPTMFVRKKLYDKHGMFDTEYKVAMDYDLLVRIRNEKFKFIPQPLIYFLPGGTSDIHFQKGLEEVRRSYNTYIGRSSKLKVWQFRQKLLEKLMHTRIGKVLFKMKNTGNVIGVPVNN